jgi:hypothetical protein
VETQVKRKTVAYGVAAVLLATFVTAFAYNFGVYNPETETPLPPIPTPPSSILTTFQSSEELRDFLVSNSKIQGPFPFYGPADVLRFNAMVEGSSSWR